MVKQMTEQESQEPHGASRAGTPSAPSETSTRRDLAAAAAAWSRGHWRLLATVAALLLLYTLAGFFLVPHLARSYLEKTVRQDLKKEISLQKLSFNPYTFTARIDRLALTETDGSAILGFEHLLVNAELSSLWHRALTLKEVTLDAPAVDVVLSADGKLNLAQLAPKRAAPRPAEKPGQMPAVRIALLQVTGGKARIEDHTRPEPFVAALAPIEFKLTDFRTAPNFENAYRFAAATARGEQLQWSGTFSVQPLGSSGQFKVGGLRAETIAAYLQDSLPFLLPSGFVDLDGRYQLAVAERLQLAVQLPSIKVRDLSLASRAEPATPWITLPHLEIADTALSLTERTLGIGAVELAGAKVTVWRNPDGSLNLQQLFASSDSAAGSAPASTPTTTVAARPVTAAPSAVPAAPSPASAPQPGVGGSAAANAVAAPPANVSASVDVPTSQPAAAATPWSLSIAKASLTEATVDAEDRSVIPAAKFSLTPISLTAESYSSQPGSVLKLSTDIGINGQGRLITSGDLQLQPLTVQTNIKLSGFDLAAVQPYIARLTAMTLNSGRVATEGVLHYSAAAAQDTATNGKPVPERAAALSSGDAAHVTRAGSKAVAPAAKRPRSKAASPRVAAAAAPPARLQFSGDIQVSDLATKDNFLNQDFIKWQLLKVSGLDYQMAPDKLSIKKIYALKPYGRVIIESDRKLNVAKVLNPHAAAAPAPDTNLDADPAADADLDAKLEAHPPVTTERGKKSSRTRAPKPPRGEVRTAAAPQKPVMPARIDLITIEDGWLQFADLSVNPNFSAGIRRLKGTVTGLSSVADSRAQVKLEGNVNRYAPVSITGDVNLLSATMYTDIAMNFRNIELTLFNPYSGKFAGYDISKGKLSTELHYKVQNRALDAQHHILIDQLEFGAATNSKDAVSLPVKLAVALLKDRHGLIDLNLPVSGSMDDPKFRLGPIIWQVVKNLLVKAVTAPFALLGSLFGGGEELAYVDFAPGSAELKPDQAEKLGKLNKALIERPQLNLDVPLHTVDEADQKALAQAAFDQALAFLLQKKAGAAEPTPPQRLKALTALYEQQFGAKPAYPENLSASDAAPSEGAAEKAAAKDSKDPTAARIGFLESQLRGKFSADPAKLDALGKARAHAVRDTILSGEQIEPERIFMTARKSEAKATGDNARMELKLE